MGHSLGGGLALIISVRFGIPAITFDSSPRVFDGLGDFHEPAPSVLIFQEGEILEWVRTVWRKNKEVFQKEDIYKVDYDFPKGISKHRIDSLAPCTLRQGSVYEPSHPNL